MIKPSPFKHLELQLQLDKLEKEWEVIREEYNKDKENVEIVDEILKITIEKIKVLAEINMSSYEA